MQGEGEDFWTAVQDRGSWLGSAAVRQVDRVQDSSSRKHNKVVITLDMCEDSLW